MKKSHEEDSLLTIEANSGGHDEASGGDQRSSISPASQRNMIIQRVVPRIEYVEVLELGIEYSD